MAPHCAQASSHDRSAATYARFALDAVDNLSAHVALLDRTGRIIFANAAMQERLEWRQRPAHQGIANLASLFKGCANAFALSELLENFLSGSSGKLAANYKVESRSGQQWFRMKGSILVHHSETVFLIVNEDITRIRKAELLAARLATLLLRLQEHERQVISQELHDSTAQHLVSMDLSLMNLKAVMQPNTMLEALLADIDRSLEEAIKELRTFTYLLHPAELESNDLVFALQRYVQGFARRSGLRTELDLDPHADKLPAELQTSMLRIIQEALANVHRHAGASRVYVRCRLSAAGARLLVLDNGHGISRERDSLPKPGVGLPGMRMRVIQLGGAFSIRSGHWGTLVRARIPLATAEVSAVGWEAAAESTPPRARYAAPASPLDNGFSGATPNRIPHSASRR